MRFRKIETSSGVKAIESVSHRNYILSHTRSPTLERKNKFNNSSLDSTLNQLMNWEKITPDDDITETFRQLFEVLKPICDHEQLMILHMASGNFTKNTSAAEQRKPKGRFAKREALVEKEEHEPVPVVEDIEPLITKRGKLRKNAELLVEPLLPGWIAEESSRDFPRDGTQLQKTLYLFVKCLGPKKSKTVCNTEGFLLEIPNLDERLKDFLQKVQRLAEDMELETPEERGSKLVMWIVQHHFIPQLSVKKRHLATESLQEHRDNSSKAFRVATAIFTWI